MGNEFVYDLLPIRIFTSKVFKRFQRKINQRARAFQGFSSCNVCGNLFSLSLSFGRVCRWYTLENNVHFKIHELNCSRRAPARVDSLYPKVYLAACHEWLRLLIKLFQVINYTIGTTYELYSAEKSDFKFYWAAHKNKFIKTSCSGFSRSRCRIDLRPKRLCNCLFCFISCFIESLNLRSHKADAAKIYSRWKSLIDDKLIEFDYNTW